VEQLAEVRDDITTRVPGLLSLKQNAQVWLGKSKSAAEAAKTTKVLQDQASRIASLEAALRDQGSRLEQALQVKAAAAA